MSVLLILGRFYRKRTKNNKIWVISKVHAVAKGSFAAVWPRGENGQSRVRRSEGLRCGVTLLTAWKIVVFCLVSLFRSSEYLSIGLMRTL